MVLRSRLVGPLAAVALVAAGVPAWSASQPVDAQECGPGDRPETGVQGQVPVVDQLSGRSQQGYWCHLRPVGSNDIGGQGGDTQMTWYGDCAYRSTPGPDGDEVAVLDVRDPVRPTVVHTVKEDDWSGRGGVLGIHEGLHVNERRGLLVVPLGTGIWTYDVRDCRRPRLLGSLDFGLPPDPVKSLPWFDDGIHSGKLSPDGTLYYATDLGNGAVSMTGPCLTVLDLRDPRRPRLVTRWGADFPCHDLSLSPDGNRAYVGYYEADVGHPAAVVGAFLPVPASHPVSGLRVVDVSEVQAHRPDPELTVLSELTGGRQHTETYAEIGGRRYVIAAEEGSCPGGNGRIVDVTDERNPVQVAEVPLAVNSIENCATYRADSEASNLLLYMSHYVSVDDPSDASLAFFTWYSSGLRVFDIRDPRNPVEVAYLNPAVGAGSSASHDSSTTYTRYLPRTGQVWFGSSVGGFHVAELAPHLRPEVPGGRRTWSVPPQANPVRAASPTFDVDRLLSTKGAKWWCTSGAVPEHHA